MNYVYKNCRIEFTIKSNYLKEPVTFSIKRKEAPSPAVLRRLENEIACLEQWAWDQDMPNEELREAYVEMARSNFSRILRGELHVICIELKRLKTATHLNEKGENDYRIVRETRTPFRKWVR